MRRIKRPVVSKLMVDHICEALTAVDDARAELACVNAHAASLADRREAHARVTHAFDVADALLRQATAAAKHHSFGEWSPWRQRLSNLDTARQIHLLAEQDEPGLRPTGSMRAIDTGMSGPDIGDLLHGQSRPPGTPPTYGLDIEALLASPVGVGSRATDPGNHPYAEHAVQAAVAPPSRGRSAPSGQAA